MAPDKMHLIEELLKQTSSAHGEYETHVLNGVYDQEWAKWYARWAVEHGLNDLVKQAIDAEQWGQILRDLNEQHQQTDRQQSWAEFTAQQVATLYT
jgi:hypothetical protein